MSVVKFKLPKGYRRLRKGETLQTGDVQVEMGIRMVEKREWRGAPEIMHGILCPTKHELRMMEPFYLRAK